MAIVGYVVLAWFIGMGAADMSKSPPRQKVHPEWGNTCRAWCHRGILKSLVPWPIRRGQWHECRREGDKDGCTGEIYTKGKWVPGTKPKPWPSPSKWHYEQIDKINNRK